MKQKDKWQVVEIIKNMQWVLNLINNSHWEVMRLKNYSLIKNIGKIKIINTMKVG
jgi:flagellar biogenesis protein FliO